MKAILIVGGALLVAIGISRCFNAVTAMETRQFYARCSTAFNLADSLRDSVSVIQGMPECMRFLPDGTAVVQ